MVEPSFDGVVQRMCDGDESAVSEFIDIFGPQVELVIRKRLSPSLRSRYDTVDFAQMVWASFYRDRDSLARFRTPRDLIRYLMAMARNKLISEVRRARRAKRGSNRCHQSLDELAETGSGPSSKEPTPSQIVVARERYETMKHEQSERDQRIFELRLSGSSCSEIATELGIDQRTARRVLVKLASVGQED